MRIFITTYSIIRHRRSCGDFSIGDLVPVVSPCHSHIFKGLMIGNSEISCHTWYITVPYNVVFRIDQVIELGRGRCEVNRAIERALQ